jgi:hypothetical protein
MTEIWTLQLVPVDRANAGNTMLVCQMYPAAAIIPFMPIFISGQFGHQ